METEITLPEGCGQEKPAVATGYILNDCYGAVSKKRPAVVVCPGGGYRFCSGREADPIAMQYAAAGYHTFVLEYSVETARFPVALQELASLVAMIRQNAEEWHIEADKIVVTGFSAGGHLAGSLGVFWNQEFVYKPLGLQAEDIQPNGMILCYPVITSGEYCHAGSFKYLLGEEAAQDEEKRAMVSLEKHIGPHVPKTFLWHTVTDQTVPVQNSLLLLEELVKHQVNVEFHLYPVGCHGLALANEDTCDGQEKMIVPQCQSWIDLAKCWMEHEIEK